MEDMNEFKKLMKNENYMKWQKYKAFSTIFIYGLALKRIFSLYLVQLPK